MFHVVNFIKIVVYICKQASEKLKCFFWRRIIIFHKYWLFCLYSWRWHSLWPFVLILSVIHKQQLKQCNFSIDQSALLTWFQTDFTSSLWNFLSLGRRSSSPRNVSMQRQGARKNGCFQRPQRAKLQSNTCTWGMPGGRLEVLELTDIFTPLLNKPPTLWYRKLSFSVREVTCIKLCILLSFLSPLYFVIDCVN